MLLVLGALPSCLWYGDSDSPSTLPWPAAIYDYLQTYLRKLSARILPDDILHYGAVYLVVSLSSSHSAWLRTQDHSITHWHMRLLRCVNHPHSGRSDVCACVAILALTVLSSWIGMAIRIRLVVTVPSHFVDGLFGLDIAT